MSTQEERVEAAVWLETHGPDAPPALVERFFTSADAYYRAHPIASRGSDFLTVLRQDSRAFTAIYEALARDEDPDAAWGEAVTTFGG